MIMKCPSCDKNLTKLQVNDKELDACTEGCGGIWFDKDEIWSLDEAHESPEHALLHLAAEKSAVKVDHKKIKKCPVCSEQILVRQFFDVKNEVEIDLCWGCGGLWLDPGEINRVREQYQNNAQRIQAADTYIQQVVQETSDTLNAETKLKIEDYNRRYANRRSSFFNFFRALLSRNHSGDMDTL